MSASRESNNTIDYKSPGRDSIRAMFDRIAPRYDLLNRLLSLGIDCRWRRRLRRYLPEGDGLEMLDLACGTGDVLITLCRPSRRVHHGIGLDLSLPMLRLGQRKLRAAAIDDRVQVLAGDASQLPFFDESFDLVTIAFGIRNFSGVTKALCEIRRVLRPTGKLLILEFSLPSNRALRWLYLIYFRQILPRLGALISGDDSAYRHLNRSAETFPYGEAFCQVLSGLEYTDVTVHPLTFGVASIYCANRAR